MTCKLDVNKQTQKHDRNRMKFQKGESQKTTGTQLRKQKDITQNGN